MSQINPNVSELWRQLFLDRTRPSRFKILLNELKVKARLRKPPIIIGGCGRSGTTILHAILSAHPRIYAIPAETTAFCPTAYTDDQHALREDVNLDAPFDLDYFYGKCFSGSIPATCDRWCEKTPKNVLFFRRILQHFSDNVKLIHTVRDGRDVILSRHLTDLTKYWVEPGRWLTDVAAGLEYETHAQVLTVRYEDLVHDYENTIELICDFLDLPRHEKLLNWHAHATYRRDPAWPGEVRPLHPESVGKWRRPEHQRRVQELLKIPAAETLLRKFGYIE